VLRPSGIYLSSEENASPQPPSACDDFARAPREIAEVTLADLARFRRALPPAPPLHRRTVLVRGLQFSLYESDPVPGVPPLLCVNGGLIYDHRLLWPALAPLVEGRQIILYDQRGRGKSQPPPGIRAARYEHDAGDLVALRDALDHPQFDLLGHSWGGGLAMLAAAERPTGLRRLLLIDPVGPTIGWRRPLIETVRARLDGDQRTEFESALDALRTDESIAAHARYSASLYPGWFFDRTFAEFFKAMRATSETGAVVATHMYRDGYDWRDRLRGMPVPTLIIHGADDPMPLDGSHELLALFADARLEALERCGHMPFWEQPERCFALARDFLGAP
jgi:proline iminopeptidase